MIHPELHLTLLHNEHDRLAVHHERVALRNERSVPVPPRPRRRPRRRRRRGRLVFVGAASNRG